MRLQFDILLGWLVLVRLWVFSRWLSALKRGCFFAKVPREIRESPRESAGFDCKGREVLSERRASQYTSLVLETCDFKLELHGLREAATFQPVHVMYYPCDEKLRLYSWSWGIAFRALRWHLKAAIF